MVKSRATRLLTRDRERRLRRDTGSACGERNTTMSNSITVSCHECHTPIYDPSTLAPEDRKPCPKCGATARDIHVHVSSAASVSAVASATVTHSPNVLMQAVVTLLGKTSEGDLIQAVAPPWFAIARMIEKNPSIIYQIDP